MKITVTGTQMELTKFFKAFNIDPQKFKALVEGGLVEKADHVDDKEIYKVLQDVSWETIWLAELILEHGMKVKQEDANGVYLTPEQIELFGKLGERAASARVGGSKRVSLRLNVEDDVLSIKMKKGEKRYYLSEAAISTFKQFLDTYDDDYRGYLEDNDIADPRVLDPPTQG
jgi:hypothetical protein